MWKRRLTLHLCLFALYGAGTTASARTIYVSTAGFDLNNNQGTISQPLATPGRALQLAAAGDTIYLKGGRYFVREPLQVTKQGITIASVPGEYATVEGSYIEGPDSPFSIFEILASQVSLLNLRIVGGTFYGVKIDIASSLVTTGVRIRGCRIMNSGRDCVKTLNADNLLIEDCEIGPSGMRDPGNAEGIDSIGSVGVVIRRCYVHDTATNGIYLKGGARDGLVENCRVENTGEFAGILLGQDTDIEFMRDGVTNEAINCVARNNLIINTGAAGLGTFSGKNILFENNTLFNVAHTSQAGLWIVRNSREIPPQQVTFRRNIIVTFSSQPMIFFFDLTDHLESDWNIFYNNRNFYEFRHETSRPEALQVWDFVQWKQSYQADRRSGAYNPLVDVGKHYRLMPESPALARGEFYGVLSDTAQAAPVVTPPDRGASGRKVTPRQN